MNPDVAKLRVNPLIHFLSHGLQEGRMAPPVYVLPNAIDLMGFHTARPEDIDSVLVFKAWNERAVRSLNNPTGCRARVPKQRGAANGILAAFRPQAAVVSLVERGIADHYQLASAAVFDDEKAPASDDALREAMGGPEAYAQIGDYVAERLMRELAHIAVECARSGRGSRYLTDNKTFSLDLILRLAGLFPVAEESLGVFFRLLHSDLLDCIRRQGVAQSPWGTLVVDEDTLMLHVQSASEAAE